MKCCCRTFAAVCCAVGVAWVPAVARALTAQIDDSGTLVRSPTVQMHWPGVSPRQTNGTAMNGSTVVQVRLNVAPWLRRTGRIFLVLPAQPPGPIRAAWTTQGRLLAGQVISGQRTLVYAGLIGTPLLEDVLQLTLTVDGRQLQQSYGLDFRFEMEAP